MAFEPLSVQKALPGLKAALFHDELAEFQTTSISVHTTGNIAVASTNLIPRRQQNISQLFSHIQDLGYGMLDF
jgi:hypothetical protein